IFFFFAENFKYLDRFRVRSEGQAEGVNLSIVLVSAAAIDPISISCQSRGRKLQSCVVCDVHAPIVVQIRRRSIMHTANTSVCPQKHTRSLPFYRSAGTSKLRRG